MAIAANLAQFTGFSVRNVLGPKRAPIKVFLSGVYSSNEKPKSDFELMGGAQTLVFVSIPRLAAPVNRLVFGTVLVRSVNVGARSMSDAQLTTVYSKDLWDPSLDIVDRGSIASIRGAYDTHADIQHIYDRWFVTRTLPRLDPMTAAPVPVSFLLQIHGSSPEGPHNKDTPGKLEIIVSGPDLVPLRQVLDVRPVSADTGLNRSRLEEKRIRVRKLHAGCQGGANYSFGVLECDGPGVVSVIAIREKRGFLS